MRVIVTRPAAQAADWVLKLQTHGIDAVALPLIQIEAVDDATALRVAWNGLARQRLVVFVSTNAVEQFFAQRPPSCPWPDAVLAGSPGPGTTRALRALGVAFARIVEPASDAVQFDSESLWVQLGRHDWQGAGVLIVRGDIGRDWLGHQLQGRGATVEHVTAYRRVAPRFDAPESQLLREAIERPETQLWLFSSSEAIANLTAVASPGTDWSRARCVVTHPRIAERARQLGFARMFEARPSLDAVVACIQSIRP